MKELFVLGSHQEAVKQAEDEAGSFSWADRIWSKDASLWKDDAAHKKIIENSLGWLTVASDLRRQIPEISSFVDTVRSRQFTTACLLGMGGSSLCPEVCALTYGTRPGYLKLEVLDTTDPASIAAAENSFDLTRTLFIVASKSGGTIESASLQKYFYEALRKLKGGSAGENFVAITDPGTSLDRLGSELSFSKIFRNPNDIGGRYSALSLFGLVPMALIGLDLDQVLERALRMAERCRSKDVSNNPGLRLGISLGVLSRSGIDKMTLVLPAEIHSFGYWIEQLVAESTGKEGLGIVPVEGEPLTDPSFYPRDRVFVHIGLEQKNDASLDLRIKTLAEAGHPVLSWEISSSLDLAGEFFLWEFATAAAGAVLKIDPFDQPNVQESKDNTQRLIRQFRDSGKLDDSAPVSRQGDLSLFRPPSTAARILPKPGAADAGFDAILASFLHLAGGKDYLALLAYLERSTKTDAALREIRLVLRDKLRTATTAGFGPRFLHSTGQLHKGGANNGIFLQITADDKLDREIPGEGYSFGTLKKAQAIGDLQALEVHGRRALRVHIGCGVSEGLEALAAHLRRILG